MDPFITGVGDQRHTDSVGPEMRALPPDFSHLDRIDCGFEKQSISIGKVISQSLTKPSGGKILRFMFSLMVSLYDSSSTHSFWNNLALGG